MEKRNTRRIPVSREVTLSRGGNVYRGFLISISEQGLQLLVLQAPELQGDHPGRPFAVTLPVSPSKTIAMSCVEVWSDGDIMGVHILEPSAEYKAFYKQSFFEIKKEITHDAIAVIGMGCYYPGAPTLKAFWENILARRREFRKLPDHRLPLSDYYDADPTVPDKTYADRAAVIDGFTFDWIKRGIPKRVVDSSDIVHWLALEVALRALEDAGYTRQTTPCDRTGVILGNTLTGEYSRSQNMRLRWPYVGKILKAAATERGLSRKLTDDLLQTMEKYYKSAFAPVTEDTLAGNLSNTIAGRICNFLDLHGGGYTVDGACSSSLIAVATAATALSNGTLDVALAGGIDISLDTFELVGFAKTNALTPGDMRVYDRMANGFIPGEGAGFVILKRLQDARRHGNEIYAVLRGWGISSDGKGGITAPKAESQALAIRRAYGKAGYGISSVDFIEGHGTGTAAGDRAEVEGIAMVMDSDGPQDRLRSCGITSLKSLIGHTKAASGIGGFIKAVLAVNRRIIPPTAGCSEPNAVFQDKARSLFPVLHGEIRDSDQVIRAGVSGMGFGGINCHVTIESYGEPTGRLDTSIGERELLASHQETEVFPISARNRQDMLEKIDELKKLSYGISASELTDLSSYLAQGVDPAHHFRVAVVAHSPDGLIDCLGRIHSTIADHEFENETVKAGPQQDIWIGHSKKAPRIGFLFPGQGSQQLNMGRTLADRHPWARDLVALTDPYLAEQGYGKITGSVYVDTDRALDGRQIEAWKKTLSNSEIAQPAICLCSLLWMRHLEHLGIAPQAVGGHSLGELSAFHAAGAFYDMALLRFAAFRGGITAAKLHEAGVMASLACDRQKAGEILDKADGYAVIANMNSPVQTVVSGERMAIEDVLRLAAAAGIKTKRLSVANAFHSRFMTAAASTLAGSAPIPATFEGSRVRLFSSIDGGPVPPGTDLRQHFARQLTHTVDFISLVDNMTKECDFLIEVGPGRVLSDLARSITAGKDVFCLPVEAVAGDDRSLNRVLACYFVHGGTIKWPALFQSRLVRSFIPASERVFIENPCERPLPAVGTEPPASVHSGTQEVPAPGGTGQDRTGHRDKEEQPADDHDETPERLLDMVSNMTGFPVGSMSLENRLLDDLNLDSIKAAEIVAKAVKLYDAPGILDPAGFANSSLKEIYEQIVQGKKKGSPVPQSPPGDAWVRDFTVKYVPRPLTPEVSRDLQHKKVLIVSEGMPREYNGALGDFLGRNRLLAKSIDYDRLFVDPPDSPGDYDYFLFILPVEHNAGGPFTAGQTRAMAGRMHSIAATVAAMKARSPKPVYAVLQFGGRDFFACDSTADIEAKGAVAFLSSLHQESPGERIRVLQFSRNSPLAIERACDELRTGDAFVAAMYDDNFVRHIPVLSPIRPQEFLPRSVTWTGSDVVLVTGGARGITAACALAFALRTGVRLAIVGSTSNAESDPEIRESLGHYSENDIPHRYYSCDVADKDAVASLLERIAGELGPVTGFIHGAAVNRPRRTDQVSLEDAYKEIGPKVLGAINILDSLRDKPPKLVVAFGSIIGVTGMAGNAWYGFSNEVLNLLLLQFGKQNPGVETVTCAFSIWAEIGMGARMGSLAFLSKMGIEAIPKEKGIDHFIRLATSTAGQPQIIVAGRLGSLDVMRSRQPARRTRFTGEILFFEQGVELETKAVLTTAQDKYLNHHVFRGVRLFPTVFGIEAMYQAVTAVSGAENAGTILMRDIKLSYPITVEPDGQTEIRIKALMQDAGSDGSSTPIKAAVATEQAGFARDCFEATFVLNSGQAPGLFPGETTGDNPDIEPLEDLYGHMLFQGPGFQRIGKIISMTADHCIFEASTQPPDPDFDRDVHPFTAGDPYFRDTLLQSVQIILPDVVALPVAIERWEIYPKPQGIGKYIVIVHILRRNDDTIVSDVTAAYPNGMIVEKINGYTVKIIERRKDAPALSDLLSPDQWDERRVNDRVSRLCGEAGAVAPAVALKHIPRLPKMTRTERHSIEQKLFERVCRAVVKEPSGAPGPAAVAWTERGKPFLPGNDGVALSSSHDARLLICSAGPVPQGCDVEPVIHRDRDEWDLMLGKGKSLLPDSMEKEDEAFDRAATRIWCAVEALRKATDMQQDELTFKARTGDCVIFNGPEHMTVFTFPVRLLRGPERIIAVATQEKSAPPQPNETGQEGPSALKERQGERGEYGPAGQKVFVHRFDLGLKDSSTISGGVNFASYARWLGDVREAALKPIGECISEEFHSGHFMVTNHTDIRIVRHVRNHEGMEARTWVDRIFGYGDSSLMLKFQWSKLTADGTVVPAAFSEQQVSWINVTGHGLVEPVECPSFFSEFLRKNGFMPKLHKAEQAEDASRAEAAAPPDLGGLIREYDLIGADRRLDAETTVETSMQHSNLAQNIYFSNYFVWQGHLIERFMYGLDPRLYMGMSRDSQFATIRCRVTHLREAMPFDTIAVTLQLHRVWRQGLELYFEYFKAAPPAGRTKLAYGNHTLIWSSTDESGRYVPQDMPGPLIDKIVSLRERP